MASQGPIIRGNDMALPEPLPERPPDPARPRGLGRHLVAVLALKAVVLFALWQVWVAPNRVTVDRAAMGERLASVSNATTIRENHHDRSVGR